MAMMKKKTTKRDEIMHKPVKWCITTNAHHMLTNAQSIHKQQLPLWANFPQFPVLSYLPAEQKLPPPGFDIRDISAPIMNLYPETHRSTLDRIVQGTIHGS